MTLQRIWCLVSAASNSEGKIKGRTHRGVLRILCFVRFAISSELVDPVQVQAIVMRSKGGEERGDTEPEKWGESSQAKVTALDFSRCPVLKTVVATVLGGEKTVCHVIGKGKGRGVEPFSPQRFTRYRA